MDHAEDGPSLNGFAVILQHKSRKKARMIAFTPKRGLSKKLNRTPSTTQIQLRPDWKYNPGRGAGWRQENSILFLV